MSTHFLTTTLFLFVTSTSVYAHIGHNHAEQPDKRSVQSPKQGRPPMMEKVELPEPSVTIRVDGEFRVMTTNTLPDHEIGEFPNPNNPNALRSVEREIRIPLNPELADRRIPSRPEFGVGLNGVIFDSGTGEFWTVSGERGRSAWNYDAGSEKNQGRFGVDFNHGHIQPTGKYHYHGVPTALVESLGSEHVHDGHVHEMIQLGWAFDGFPVYAPYGYEDPDDATSGITELASSYRLKEGDRPGLPDGPGGAYDGTYSADYEYVEGLGDLDESNGRTGVTPEFPDGTYYYVITDEFPSIPRTWVGTPDASMRRGGPGGQGEDGDRPGGMRGPRSGDDGRSSQAAPSVDTESSVEIVLEVNPAYFMEEALVDPIISEMQTLSDGTESLCYVIRTYSEPHEHEMGPWAPKHIDDGAESGGIWFHDGEVLDVDGEFVLGVAELYDDPEWKLFRDDGSVRVTDTEEAFFAAARPDVDPKYKNYVVEGKPEWIDRNVFEYVIPVQPIYQEEPTLIGGPRGGGEPGERRGMRPPRGQGENTNSGSHDDAGSDHRHGGPAQTVVGVAFNGVNFDPPAPVDAILAAYTIAPFDDAGGHINPYNGYHYHAVTGHTKEIKQPDGHAPMIGYIMDGFGLYAHSNEDGSVPADLDECGGHSDDVRGYHYHAGAAAENQIIKGFRGVPGAMSSDK